MAQRKRGGPITHRSQDRNLALISLFFSRFLGSFCCFLALLVCFVLSARCLLTSFESSDGTLSKSNLVHGSDHDHDRCTTKLFRTVENLKLHHQTLFRSGATMTKPVLHTCICSATTLQRHTWQVDYRKPTKLISKRSRTIATSYSHHSPPSLVGGCR